jgi:hypothetical protein
LLPSATVPTTRLVGYAKSRRSVFAEFIAKILFLKRRAHVLRSVMSAVKRFDSGVGVPSQRRAPMR